MSGGGGVVWWQAFRNIKPAGRESGFVANFIDTAFNDCLFMWDSAFILLFARYGSRAFDFQRTLDNFYAKQHPDGYAHDTTRHDTRVWHARNDTTRAGSSVARSTSGTARTSSTGMTPPPPVRARSFTRHPLQHPGAHPMRVSCAAVCAVVRVRC